MVFDTHIPRLNNYMKLQLLFYTLSTFPNNLSIHLSLLPICSWVWWTKIFES